MDTDTVLAVAKTPSLYFCPVCGKPSTQETSFTRHVQYCRRRAATKRTSRPRACRHCRTTKSKCDAQWPCSRCTSKHKECIYDKPWPVADAAGEPTTVKAPEPAQAAGGEGQQVARGADAGASSASSSSTSSDAAAGSRSNSPIASHATSLSGQSGGQAGQEACCPDLSCAPPFTSADNGSSTMALAGPTPTILSATATTTTPMVLESSSFGSGTGGVPNFSLSQGMSMYGLNSFNHFGAPGMGSTSVGLTMAQPSSFSTVHMPSPLSLHLPYAASPDPIMEISDGLPGSAASADLRRLITSMVRTFPRMMTRPGVMPPFIHRIGCGLHYANVDVEGTFLPAITDISSSSSSSSSPSLSFPVYGGTVANAPVSVSTSTQQTALFTPLPIMAACVGISHAFVTRSAHSDEFLWRSIDKEHQTIEQRMETLSFGEIFVAIQAVAIYTTMRLIVYGREYFSSDSSLLDTMGKLSERFHELWQGPFMPVHDENRELVRSERPNWEDWIFDETRRRITMTCWLMSLAVNPRAHAFRLSGSEQFPLPSSRRLWEAESRAAWEREYDSDQFEKHILVQSAAHSSTKNEAPKLKLSTVSDLARAIDRAVAAEGSLGLPSNDALYEDDLLAYWHAGVDSLGMMVTAAAAQHAFGPVGSHG